MAVGGFSVVVAGGSSSAFAGHRFLIEGLLLLLKVNAGVRGLQ